MNEILRGEDDCTDQKEAIIEGNEAWSEDADTHIYINRVMIICVIGFETDKEQKENDRFSW